MSYCVRGVKRRVDDTVVPLSSCNVGTTWRWVYITCSAQCELTSGRQTGEETYRRAEVPGRGPPEGSRPPVNAGGGGGEGEGHSRTQDLERRRQLFTI